MNTRALDHRMMSGGHTENTVQRKTFWQEVGLAVEHVEDIDSGWNLILLLLVALFNYFILAVNISCGA